MDFLHILETMGVEARIYHYKQTVHTFYIMFAHGQHYLQVEIGTKKTILETMIDRFPNILKEEISHYEELINKEVKEIAEGDIDIELSLRSSSPYNDVIDVQSTIMLYHYYSLAIMIYTFAESSLKQICEYSNLKICKVKGSKLFKYYETIKQTHEALPLLDEIWKERDSFGKIRNRITHEMKTQNHIATQEYLHKQLDDAYNMLCHVLNQVLVRKE